MSFSNHSTSPRNHMLFTPLLASTTVGTLEFRSIAEPVRYVHILSVARIDICLMCSSSLRHVDFIQGKCRAGIYIDLFCHGASKTHDEYSSNAQEQLTL